MTNTMFRAWAITVVFLLMISFSLINWKNNIVKDITSAENRQMAAMPVFEINHIDRFSKNFDDFFSDNFSIRSTLIKYYNQVTLTVFKKSPFPDKVVIGNDGWLFMAGYENDSYLGRNMLRPDQLESFKLELEYRQNYLKDRGIQFYFLVAPVKANIYPEMVPGNFFRFSKQCWGEQLLEYLNTNSKIKTIDIYSVFRENKDKEQLYYKLDNHWNEIGGFYAANEVLAKIKTDFSQVSLNDRSNYVTERSLTNGGNIVGMLSNVGDFSDTIYRLSPQSGFKAQIAPRVGYPVLKEFPYPEAFEINKEIKGSTKPRVLIISDSFGENIFPFVSEQFGRSVKIFDSWQYKLNEEIVKAEKPQIVILMVVESNIRNMLDYQSRFSK